MKRDFLKNGKHEKQVMGSDMLIRIENFVLFLSLANSDGRNTQRGISLRELMHTSE